MSKNKLQKFTELADFKNVIQPNITETHNKEFSFKGKWNTDYFKNDNPIILEVGCGKAEYTVGLAQKYPDINFIAIDIKGSRLWKGAKTSLEKNITNAVFLRTKIDLLQSFFAEDEISEIWVPFPDPQPQKPNKRLISPKFLNLYRKFVKNNATIHLKTDSLELHEYALEVLELNKIKPIICSNNIYSNELSINIKQQLDNEITKIQTFYEKKFIADGKKITYLKFCLNKEEVIL